MEYFREPFRDKRVRLDPLDPKTSGHADECEYRDETDPTQLKLLFDVKDGTGGPYWWVGDVSALPRQLAGVAFRR